MKPAKYDYRSCHHHQVFFKRDAGRRSLRFFFVKTVLLQAAGVVKAKWLLRKSTAGDSEGGKGSVGIVQVFYRDVSIRGV